jgi:predicted glycosyltransferase involved in capsule biosynthesis
MKTDLTDITFLILVRLDSIQRLENILCVTEQLCRHFNTNVIVREADNHNNGMLKSLLSRKVRYEFIEDKDPVLYKTKHFNQMVRQVKTAYLAIWDADIVVDKRAIVDCADKLRKNEADVTYPYNGICFDVPDIVKNAFLKKEDVRFLFRHKNKMERLYPHPLVGGAVMMNIEKYLQAGAENEKHYGWGNDDFDRYYRFVGLGYKIYRVNTSLFHLSHPRGDNSQFRSPVSNKISSAVRFRMESSSKLELQNDIKNLNKEFDL